MSKQTKIEGIRTIIQDNRKSGRYKYLFFIDGNYYVSGKKDIKKIKCDQVSAILDSNPDIQCYVILIDKRKYNDKTGWGEPLPDATPPPELKGRTIQNITINDKNSESEAVYNLLELLTKNSREAWEKICYFKPE